MYITTYSAQTASGWGKKLNAISILNNITRLQQHPLILGNYGGDLLCAMCEHLPVGMDYSQRIEKMIQFAAEEMNGNLGEKEKVCLIMGVPAENPGKPKEIFDTLENTIRESFSGKLDSYYQIRGGNESGISLINKAVEIWTELKNETLILGVLDSHHNEEYIKHLKKNKAVYNPISGQGVIAGEASVFIKLSRNSHDSRQKILFRSIADSLADIFDILFQDYPELIIEQVIGNLNTRTKINDYILAATKFSKQFRNMEMYQTPSRFFGDTGAAEIFAMLLMDYIFRSKENYQTSLILERSESQWSAIVIEGIR